MSNEIGIEWGIVQETERDSKYTVARITVFPKAVAPPHYHNATTETYK